MEPLITNVDNSVENNGINNGVIVGGNNYGTINYQNKVINSSAINEIVRTIGTLCSSIEIKDDFDIRPFEIEDKITYNNVVRYKGLIESYAQFSGICNKSLNDYDDTHFQGKTRIFNWIKTIYLQVKGNVCTYSSKNEILDISDPGVSDAILDGVKEIIENRVLEGECDATTREDIDCGVICFMCYCFMQCKILEKPVCC